jgi:glucosamine-6-phosphate deaminase
MPEPIKSFTVDALEVRIYANGDALAAAAAEAARDYLKRTLSAKPTAAAILASAASQVKFLAALTASEGIAWERLTLFHMDEYLGISAEHPASFRRFLLEHVLSKIKPGAFHFIAGDALEPLDELSRYAKLLQSQPIDICCLGIGENGHIAFNDPPVADFNDDQPIKLVQLDLKCRRQQVGEGAFPSLDAVPQYAYTLTIPTLCAARKLICVVPEKRKAEAVRAALRGPVTTACPASILRTLSRATLYLDADSASLL